MSKLKKAGYIAINVITWIIILTSALYAFVTLSTKDDSNVTSVFGYTPMVVQTDSMAPTFNAGDMIFIKQCDTKTLKEGDIVCFHTIIQNQYVLNTHRIVAVESLEDGNSRFTTRGDNNDVSDNYTISNGDIVGIYVGQIGKLGNLLNYISTSTGFLCIIVLPMLLFFAYQVYHLIMVAINLRRALAAEQAQIDGKNAAESIIRQERESNEAELEKARREAEEAKAELEKLKASMTEKTEE